MSNEEILSGTRRTVVEGDEEAAINVAGAALAAGLDPLEVVTVGFTDRIKQEVNVWAAEKEYPFVVYGEFSMLGDAFVDKPGREIRTHRDFWRYANNDQILTFELEIATRGFYPVHRGQVALSLPMTDEDIGGFIETTKEIVTGILGD